MQDELGREIKPGDCLIMHRATSGSIYTYVAIVDSITNTGKSMNIYRFYSDYIALNNDISHAILQRSRSRHFIVCNELYLSKNIGNKLKEFAESKKININTELDRDIPDPVQHLNEPVTYKENII